MKLKLNCSCGEKFILTNTASSRQHLASQIGHSFFVRCPHCKIDQSANVGLVYAESSYKYARVSTTVGAGAVGFFFGPLGTLIGLAIGAASGTGIKNSDKVEVNRFNNS